MGLIWFIPGYYGLFRVIMGYSGLLWGFVKPIKMTCPRENLPWLSKSLLESIRKKASLYKAKHTNKADLWAKYELYKRQTSAVLSGLPGGLF